MGNPCKFTPSLGLSCRPRDSIGSEAACGDGPVPGCHLRTCHVYPTPAADASFVQTLILGSKHDIYVSSHYVPVRDIDKPPAPHFATSLYSTVNTMAVSVLLGKHKLLCTDKETVRVTASYL